MFQTVAMSPRVEKFFTDIFPYIVVFPCTYVMLLKFAVLFVLDRAFHTLVR